MSAEPMNPTNVNQSVIAYGESVKTKFTTKIDSSISLGASADLNTIKTPGFYYQRTNVDASNGTNYPEPLAGTMIVQNAGSLITTQLYIVYSSGRVYARSRYNNNWGPWGKLMMVTDTVGEVVNAATADKLKTPRNINGIPFDGSADITITQVASSSTAANALTADTATKLTTPRTINGVAFDGTANITVADTVARVSANAKLPKDASLDAYGDLNTLINSGSYYQAYDASASAANNYPVQKAGSLLVQKILPESATQLYIAAQTGHVFVRAKINNAWNAWVRMSLVTEAGNPLQKSQPAGNVNLDTLTTDVLLYQPSDVAATPELGYPVAKAGSLSVKQSGTSSAVQEYTQTETGRQYVRTFNGTTWNNWIPLSFSTDTAQSAIKLTTPRNINGIPFDGSADITIPAPSTVANALTANKLSNGRLINGVVFDGSSDITIVDKPARDSAAEKLPKEIQLAQENLNNAITAGIYSQAVVENATTANNYPVSNGIGTMLVTTVGSTIIVQDYTVGPLNDTFTRTRIGGTWGSWKRVLRSGETLTVATPPKNDNSIKVATTAYVLNAGLHFRSASGTAINANTTLLSADSGHWYEVQSNGLVITLPALSTAPGGITTFTLKAQRAFTLTTTGGELIEGGVYGKSATIQVAVNDVVTVVSNSPGMWYVIGYGKNYQPELDTKLTKDQPLPANANLNNIVSSGVHYQQLNADAATGTNYPVPSAGTLLVLAAGSAITTQQYCVHNTGETYTRSRYAANWSSWKKIVREGDKATAASNADNATLAATATRLATPRTINGVPFDGSANITLPIPKENPLPDVWIPLVSDLKMITGYGGDVKIGDVVIGHVMGFDRGSRGGYIDTNGTYQIAEVGVPRFETKGLLVEPKTTNLVHDTDCSSNQWLQTSAVVREPNVVIDGYTLTKIKRTVATNSAYLYIRVRDMVVGKRYTISTVVTKDSKLMTLRDFATVGTYIYFDPATGTITQTGSGVISAEVVTGRNTYRIAFTYDNTVAGDHNISGNVINTDAINDWVTSGALQLEQNSCATSFIPTSGAATTREGDMPWVEFYGNTPNFGDITFSATYDTKKTFPVGLAGEDVSNWRQTVFSASASVWKNSLSLQASTNSGYGYVFRWGDDGYGLNLMGREPLDNPRKLIAARKDTVTKKISVWDNNSLTTITPDTPTEPQPFSNRIYFGAHETGDYRKSLNGHLKNIRIWHRALTDDQLKALE